MEKQKDFVIADGVNNLEKRISGAEEIIEDTTTAKLNLDETGPSPGSRVDPKRK